MAREISAKRVILTSFFVDALDIAINIWVAVFTGSVVMAAELLQGVSDLVASGILLVGLKRPRREVYLWSFISSLVIFLFASTISFYFGLKRFLDPTAVDNILLAYVALTIGVITNGYAFYLSAKRILKEKNFSQVFSSFWNSHLIMTKNTFVLDLMGMSAATVGLVSLILYQVSGEIRFDGLGAMGIGLVLGYLSIHLIVDIRRMRTKEVGDEV